MKNKKIMLMLSLVLLASSISTALAVWSQTGVTGEWENVSGPSLLSDYADYSREGYANFTYGNVSR